MGIIRRVISWEWKGGGKREKWSRDQEAYKIDGDVKNSIGKGEAKELICMTHGHELRRWIAGGKVGGYQARGAKRKKLGQL